MHRDSGLAGSWIGITNMPSLNGWAWLMLHSPRRVGRIAALLSPFHSGRADDHGARGGVPARQDRPPRKVIVGTTVTRWYGDYPGLSGRLEQMRGLVDQMAAEARARYGRSLDLALFTE